VARPRPASLRARTFTPMSGNALTFALMFVCVGGLADIASEPWPARVRDLPEAPPIAFTWAGFHISAREPRDPEIRAGGGTGGGMYQFTVRNLKTGASTTFVAQSAGGVLLERFAGYPQLEIWVRTGAGSWSRHLYRFVGAQYRCVRIDDFTENDSSAKNAAIIATLPGSDERLYFVETRIPTS
jgi:hypothetical protein